MSNTTSTKMDHRALSRVVEQLADLRTKHGKIPGDILGSSAKRSGRSTRTLLRMVADLLKDGKLPTPQTKPRIGLTDEQKELARNEFYLWAGNSKATYDSLIQRGAIPAMSYKTFTRIVNSWPSYQVGAARAGYGEMLKRQACLTEHIPYRAYSYGIDHTKLPVRVKVPGTATSKNNKGFEYPTLTIVLDLYSRTIVSFGLYLYSPNADDVLDTLSAAFMGKETDRGWLGGLPEFLRSDNGKDFTSNAVRSALMGFGIEHDLTEAYTPRQNGRVERTNGIIKRNFAPTQPGYAKNADTESELRVRRVAIDVDSLLTLEQLEDNFQAWVEVFNNYAHPELKPLTRADAWYGSPQELRLPEDMDLWYSMLRRRDRTIHHYGIHVDNNIYQHPALGRLYSLHGRGVRVEVRTSARITGHVVVFFEGEFVCEAPYAQKMSKELQAELVTTARAQREKVMAEMNKANHVRSIREQESQRERGVPEDEITPLSKFVKVTKPDQAPIREASKIEPLGRPKGKTA